MAEDSKGHINDSDVKEGDYKGKTGNLRGHRDIGRVRRESNGRERGQKRHTSSKYQKRLEETEEDQTE